MMTCISIVHIGRRPINLLLVAKPRNFQIKNSDIFHVSAQNIDCGYSLEPPRRGGSNEYPQSTFEEKLEKKCIPL